MSKKQPPYAPEYRRQMVELVRAGRTPGELAREFECSASAIRNWVRQADRDEGRREDGLTSLDLDECSWFGEHQRHLLLLKSPRSGERVEDPGFVSGCKARETPPRKGRDLTKLY